MPKGSRGGGGGAAVAPTPPAPAPAPALTPQQRLANLVASVNSIQDFANLSYDEKMDLIDAALATPVPAGKPNTPYQQLAEYLGFDKNPPQVVTDAQLDAMPGKDLYRTVNNVGSVTSKSIVTDTLRKNDTPFFSDSGGSVYGRGLYFATNLGDSAGYGWGSSDHMTFRGKIKPGARVIDVRTLDAEVQKAASNNNRLARVINGLNKADRRSFIAAYKGYDVIDSQNYAGYHAVLNRNALVYSNKAQKLPTGGNINWNARRSSVTI